MLDIISSLTSCRLEKNWEPEKWSGMPQGTQDYQWKYNDTADQSMVWETAFYH